MSRDEKGRDWRSGHRHRLRSRFERASEEALEDHELLELLLTYGLPRVDTKPLARALLDRFGSLAAVLSAELRSTDLTTRPSRAALTSGALVKAARA